MSRWVFEKRLLGRCRWDVWTQLKEGEGEWTRVLRGQVQRAPAQASRHLLGLGNDLALQLLVHRLLYRVDLVDGEHPAAEQSQDWFINNKHGQVQTAMNRARSLTSESDSVVVKDVPESRKKACINPAYAVAVCSRP